MFRISSNPRILESMDLICKGLINLLQIKDYNTITITEICDSGGVARKTFYRNFDMKEDIVDYIICQKMGEITDRINLVDEPYKTFEMFMEYWRENDNLLRVLYTNNLYGLFQYRLARYVDLFRLHSTIVEKIKNLEVLEVYYYRNIATTLATILETWSNRNFDESLAELYDIYLMLGTHT